MVTKSMKFTDEEWKVIEQELQKNGKNFSDFARERLTKNTKTENADLKDFSELLKNNCKTLDLQVAKYISVLLERIDKQQEKINKILENKTYTEFTVAATKEDRDKVEDINFYRVGDVLENDEGFKSVILKIDRENEIFTLTPFPILTDEYYFQDSTVDLRNRILKKLKRVLRPVKS